MLTNRREVLGTMMSATLGAALPAPRLMGEGVRSPAAARPDFESVRKFIGAAIARGEATGVAVAVASGGSIVWEEGFGSADREAGVRVTPHTPFSMASITKAFTATTLMTLVAEGRLRLDDRANKYLGASGVAGTNGDVDAVTVRMLGAHISGLPGMFEVFDRDEAKLALTASALLGEYGRLAYPPRSCYEYSNIGYAALDVIASKLTGVDLGTLMQRRVLAPLGLRDSFFDTDEARLAGGALRYDAQGRAIPYYTTSTPASGELYASAHDLARFAMFHMRGRVAGGQKILDDGSLHVVHETIFVGPSGIGTTFGWASGQIKSGVPFLFKGGGQPGVATILYMIPSRDVACLVLTNRTNGKEFAYDVCDQLMSRYVSEWRQPEEYSGYVAAPFAATPAFLGRWEGTLRGGTASMPVRLTIDSSGVGTLQLGVQDVRGFSAMHAEGEAFVGVSTGQIDSADAIRARANALEIKLLARGGRLVGRVFATGETARLPYVLALERASR